ncbi:uncharacterized protein G2W53_021310 [Senna tora]|uniref:Uncharacterized protein n=1 Tax=Senna tora TaxID=362788 RepID=A0A834TLP2_9FABA|nr:uncharacterized protein G2W53_021310 [Senna tora]
MFSEKMLRAASPTTGAAMDAELQNTMRNRENRWIRAEELPFVSLHLNPS